MLLPWVLNDLGMKKAFVSLFLFNKAIGVKNNRRKPFKNVDLYSYGTRVN